MSKKNDNKSSERGNLRENREPIAPPSQDDVLPRVPVNEDYTPPIKK